MNSAIPVPGHKAPERELPNRPCTMSAIPLCSTRLIAPSLIWLHLMIQPAAIHAHIDASLSVEELTARIQFSSSNDDLFVARAAAYQRQGRYDEALSDLKHVQAASPSRSDLPLRLSSVYLEKRDGASALQNADRSLTLFPGLPEAIRMRARALHLCERYQESFAEWRKIVVRAPGGAAATTDLLEMALESEPCGMEAMSQVLGIVQAALARTPSDPALRECAIMLSERTGRMEEALRLLEAQMSSVPRKEWWHAKRAGVLLRAGRTKEAMEACCLAETALSRLPENLRHTRAVGQLAAEIATMKATAGARTGKQ
jgi:predicted Zn-dependent protease